MSHDFALHPEMTVGTVAELHPDTLPVLARHGIDLCCGARRSLEFVALAHGLDLAGLLSELESVRAR
ncbi:MAG TPA: DUF542 domain-containing protein [Gemmatimonadales bacterium]|nr:DUF542 domain-containing protein [Gemmatimonadales bacterium]